VILMILPDLRWDKVKDHIINELKKYFEEHGFKDGVLGLSGGLDSSVVAFLASEAIGKENLHILLLPSRATSERSLKDAKKIIEILNIPNKNVEIINIEPILKIFKGMLNPKTNIQVGNIAARIRMTILYHKSSEYNALVLGTGDKSELLLGYFTKYGDGGVDILPIGDIYKTQLRKFAEYLGIPRDIYLKPSSPELWPNQLALEELGADYSDIDPVLYLYFDKKLSINEIVEKGFSEDFVRNIINRCIKNMHKLNTPPIIKLASPS